MFIVNGGVAVHDNANSHVDDILNNYEFGREFSKNVLGIDPRIGWLIDPFGHSKTTTRVYSEIDYSSYIINRIPTKTKKKLIETQDMMFKWSTLFLNL